MVLASGTAVDLTYIEETAHGILNTGTPTFKVLRTTSRNINWERDSLETDEVRASAQVSDVRHGFGRVTGSPGYELSLAAYDDFILLGVRDSAWEGKTVAATGTCTSVSNVLTFVNSVIISSGIQVGDIVNMTGWADGDSNGKSRVIARTATTITVSADKTIADEAAATVVLTVPGEFAQSGTDITTVSIERRFQELTANQFQLFLGCAVDQMSMSIRPGSLVGGTFTILGLSSGALTTATSSTGGTPTAAATNSPMSSFVGNAFIGGVKTAVLTSLEYTVANNYSTEGVYGTSSSPDVFLGTQRVTGTASIFIEDATEINNFIAETESSIWVKIVDSGGTDFIDIKFPRVKFTAATIDPPQQGPVTLVLPFTALEDTSTNGTSASIVFQKSNV
jgi:hypothetical protein